VRAFIAAVALAGVFANGQSLAATQQPASATPGETSDQIEQRYGKRGLILDGILTRDTDDFERDIARVAAAIHYENIYEFVSVLGSVDRFRQREWSARANSIGLAARKVNRRTAAGYFVRAAIADAPAKLQLHGEATWNIRFSDRAGVELIANRDALETIEALPEGIMANFFAASLDYAASDRWTLIGMPTYRKFSDGNTQTGARGWIIYGVAPESGLSVNLRARAYDSDEDGGGLYFSPLEYRRAEVGVRLRRAINDWRVFAMANMGREYINSEPSKPTFDLSITASRVFDKDISVGLQFAYFRSSDSANNVGLIGRPLRLAHAASLRGHSVLVCGAHRITRLTICTMPCRRVAIRPAKQTDRGEIQFTRSCLAERFWPVVAGWSFACRLFGPPCSIERVSPDPSLGVFGNGIRPVSSPLHAAHHVIENTLAGLHVADTG
jgi:hypothetical protein